jgi:Leucine-rich repeat (LRR) protein
MKRLNLLILLLVTLNGISQELYSDSAFKDIKAPANLVEAKMDTNKVIKIILKKKRLTSIPKEIFTFKDLEYLDLSKNKLDSIPKDIVKLKKLRVLILSRNNLKEISKEIYKLTNLKILNISSNDITVLPKGISSLFQLEELNIWNTSINNLPNDIEKIKPLKVVDMRGILLNYETQEDLFELLPGVKLYMSPPCNCSF